ncbi:MAG: hypothetical protein ACLFRV_10895 [Acidimicrobiales bacterium]
MTEASLIIQVSHRDAVRELDQAVAIARKLLGVVEGVGVEPGWRAEESDPFRSLDELADMMIEFAPGQLAPPPFVWSIVGGVRPRFLNATLGAGWDDHQTHGTFTLKSGDEASFGAMSEAFDGLARLYANRSDEVIDQLVLSPGPVFMLEVNDGIEDDRRAIPIGWRNLFRADPDSFDGSVLPDWVVVARHERHLECTLGRDSTVLAPIQAREVRERLIEAGLLPVAGAFGPAHGADST